MLVWIISSIVVDNAHIFQGHISRLLLKGMFVIARQREEGTSLCSLEQTGLFDRLQAIKTKKKIGKK